MDEVQENQEISHWVRTGELPEELSGYLQLADSLARRVIQKLEERLQSKE